MTSRVEGDVTHCRSTSSSFQPLNQRQIALIDANDDIYSLNKNCYLRAKQFLPRDAKKISHTGPLRILCFFHRLNMSGASTGSGSLLKVGNSEKWLQLSIKFALGVNWRICSAGSRKRTPILFHSLYSSAILYHLLYRLFFSCLPCLSPRPSETRFQSRPTEKEAQRVRAARSAGLSINGEAVHARRRRCSGGGSLVGHRLTFSPS